MSRQIHLSLAALALALLSALSPATRAQAQMPADVYGDARVAAWAKDFLANKRQEVVTAVEADLKSPSPHPLASYVWVFTQQSLGRLKESAGAVSDPKLRAALGELPEVYSLYRAGEQGRAIEAYPAERAGQITNTSALFILYLSATDIDRYQEGYAYAVEYARRRPDDFQSVWGLIFCASSDDRVWTKVNSLTGPSGELAGTRVGRTLATALKVRPATYGATIAAARMWLAELPGDARALRYLGNQLRAVAQFDLAVDAFSRSTQRFPFGSEGVANWGEQAAGLIRLGKNDEAARLIRQSAALDSKDDASANRLAAVRAVGAQIGAGERGAARELLEASIKQFPDSAALFDQYAYLELTSNKSRYSYGLTYAQRAVQLEPRDQGYQWRLADALKKNGETEKAYAAWLEARKLFPVPSRDLYYQGSQLLSDLKRPDERVRLNEEAARQYPGSGWMMREYADALAAAGKTDEALAELKLSLTINGGNVWAFDRLREWTAKSGDDAKAERALEEARGQFPWVRKLWQDAADKLGGNYQAEVALWRQAAEKNPAAYWPWEAAAGAYFRVAKIDEAQAVATEALDNLTKLNSPDLYQVYSDLMWAAYRRIQTGAAKAEGLQKALEYVEKYKEGGGYLGYYYFHKASLLIALDRKKEAWQAARAAADVDPDDTDYIYNLYSGDFGEYRKGEFSALQRFVERDPYDGRKLNVAVERHVQWGGSPIIAYKLAQLCRERDPDKYNGDGNLDHSSRRLAAKALGALGANADYFTEEYVRSVYPVSSSDRYLLWYEGDRRKAQGSSSVVRVDLKTEVAEITHPDGTVERRKDNPISGKPELWQIGQAKIELAYDPKGENLTQIKSPSGSEMILDYDDAARIKTITTRTSQSGSKAVASEEELSFEYNDRDKPVRMVLKGVGEITVTYKEDGEIEKVDSTAGREIAAKVTQTFQRLLDAIGPFKNRSSSYLPELPFTDAKLEQLRDDERQAEIKLGAADTPAARLAYLQAKNAVARHLVENLSDSRGYAQEARAALYEVFDLASKGQDVALASAGGDAVGLWYELMVKTKLYGLSSEDWAVWAHMRKWLDDQLNLGGAGRDSLYRVARKVDEKPLELLPAAQWLPNSYLDIEGYWRRISLSGLTPKNLSPAPVPTTAFIRANKQEVIGTTAGLVVRKDYWRWLAFDENERKLSSDVPPSNVNASSHVSAITEDARGDLFIGTANGLMRVTGDNYADVKRWVAGPEGLPVPAVDSLAAAGDAVYVGTQRGLWVLRGERLSAVASVPEEPVLFMHGPEEAAESDAPVVFGTKSGVFALRGQNVVRLADEPAEDALWSKGHGRLFILRGDEVYYADWDGHSDKAGESRLIRGKENLKKANKVFGLAKLPIDKEVEGIAVLTDLGLSVFYNEHFEYKRLPLSDSIADARGLATRNGRTLVLSTQGVYALDRGRVSGDAGGRVYDILSADDLGVTFVARGDLGLQAVRQERPEDGAQTFSPIYATNLARDGEGRLIANDELTIVAFDKGSTTPRELFSARPAAPYQIETSNTVTSMLAASDGALWVTAGSSAFRYKDGRKEEFSIFVNPDRFPARSDMISRVVETVDHRILVVASNEGHREYKGMALSGGLLEWDGNAFQRVEVDRTKNSSLWFITGYTALDDGTAIVGTVAAFAREKNGRMVTFPVLQDASYQKLGERVPMLWLGTKGAKLGKDVWLFGCAGGLVAYIEGQWFYPDRLNWMLPDQHLANYGGRTVHAVATDHLGRVYAGTDRGLMIYDTGGGDAAAFMMTNDRPDVSYAALEQSKLQQEAEILLHAIKPDSELARKAAAILKGRSEIEALKEHLNSGMIARLPGPSGAGDEKAAPGVSEEEGKRLRAELDQKMKAQTQLLLEIERDNRSLYQMLELKPLELRAVRDQLGEGEVIIQYLPTKEKLFIQVVTRDSTELKEVAASSEELLKRAAGVSQLLSKMAGARSDFAGMTIAQSQVDVNEELAWLYDKLLRPVEPNINGSRHVYIVPVDALCYLPFGALEARTSPKPEYAAQRYVFGYLPSLYLFEVMNEQKSISSHDALVIGDPDGSLPGAKSEAGDVKTLLGGNLKPLIGDDATYDNFMRFCPSAKYLHLATHGRLDAARPERSYLLLAGGYRLSVVDISTMQQQFAQTDLAVLSACETGVGAQGMEYATLARAFATAKVPTIMATLWRVSDKTTPPLVKSFYRNVLSGDDHLTALTKAQREMIAAADKEQSNPASWSGFILFGRP